jgi:hypothetical protein
MADYQSIYSRRDFINARTNQRYEVDDIERAQRDVDNKINSALRAHLGNFDANNYRIAIPLSGTIDSIDDFTKTVQLKLDDEIKGIADDLVIAMMVHDFSENSERTEGAKQALMDYLVEHFGGVYNKTIDFTSDFLRQNKLITTAGKYFKVISAGADTGKVLQVTA